MSRDRLAPSHQERGLPYGSARTAYATRTGETGQPTERYGLHGQKEKHEAASGEDIQWIEALPKAEPGAPIFGRIESRRPNELGGSDADNLAGVAVSIAGPESKTTSSDTDGKFRVDGLAPGKYAVSATAPRQYAAFSNGSGLLRRVK
jgi:hypothetical protein